MRLPGFFKKKNKEEKSKKYQPDQYQDFVKDIDSPPDSYVEEYSEEFDPFDKTENEPINSVDNGISSKLAQEKPTKPKKKSLSFGFLPIAILGLFIIVLGAVVYTFVFSKPNTGKDLQVTGFGQQKISTFDSSNAGMPAQPQSPVMEQTAMPSQPPAPAPQPSGPEVQNQNMVKTPLSEQKKQVVEEPAKPQVMATKEEKKTEKENKDKTVTETINPASFADEMYVLKLKEEKLKRQIAIAELERRLKSINQYQGEKSEKKSDVLAEEMAAKIRNNMVSPSQFPEGAPMQFGTGYVPMQPMPSVKPIGIFDNKAVFSIDGKYKTIGKGETAGNIMVVDIFNNCVSYIDRTYSMFNPPINAVKTATKGKTKNKQVQSTMQRQEPVMTQCF